MVKVKWKLTGDARQESFMMTNRTCTERYRRKIIFMVLKVTKYIEIFNYRYYANETPIRWL